MMKKIKLLIIEEHAAVRDALKIRLKSSPALEIVAAISDLGKAESSVRAWRPEVIILGVKSTNKDDLLPTIRAVPALIESGAAVIVLTSYADDAERELFLQAGARRYLLKAINSPQLIAEIEAVATEAAVASRSNRRGTATLSI
jgi:DNA-binding NarL/FixJ family response regulator